MLLVFSKQHQSDRSLLQDVLLFELIFATYICLNSVVNIKKF